jgi:hypothetical protein
MQLMSQHTGRKLQCTKKLRTVRDAAYDHRAVHLLATLAQYQNATFSDDDDHLVEVNKEKIYHIRRMINIESMRKPFRSIHDSVSAVLANSLFHLMRLVEKLQPSSANLMEV